MSAGRNGSQPLLQVRDLHVAAGGAEDLKSPDLTVTPRSEASPPPPPPPDGRARRGVFLAFQSPVELPGIRLRELLRGALDAIREARGLPKLPVRELNKLIEQKAREMELTPDTMKRAVRQR